MALTTTQVNAAFVALLGRAAEGNANAWAVNSADTKTLASTILSVDGKFAKIGTTNIASIEQAKTNEDFVEALYQTILGRTADTDGKAVWLNALANGVSREELMTQFVAAAKANNENLSAFNNANEEFLNEIYGTLLNREVDSSGLETWTNLLNNGASKAEVVAKIIEAISANPAGDDYAIYNAKMSVANAVTAAFAGPKAGLSEAQNAALNEQLKNIISSVTSTDVKAAEEVVKEQIAQVVGSYGKETAPLTFKAVTKDMEDYKLGNAESTTAQTFKGTINLQNPDKSTISSKATLNTSNFSDTLAVDVIPSTTGKEFNYSTDGSQVKYFANIDGIKNLTINNGTAEIKGLDNTGISGNLKITGSASVGATVKETLNYLEVNTGGKADAEATIAVNASLKEYVGKGLGKDNITVSGTNANIADAKINTGAGDDNLTVSGASMNSIINMANATIDLGAGNDTLDVSGANIANATIDLGAGDDYLKVRASNIAGATINLGAGNDIIDIASVPPALLKGATINGGAGRDTMLLIGDTTKSGAITDLTLQNIEVLQAKSNDGSTIFASMINGQTLTLTKKNSTDGKLTIKADTTDIDLSKLNTKIIEGKEVALDKLTLSNVGSGATTDVTVKLTAKDANIAETITLHNDAKNANNAVKITGFTADKTNKAANDKLDLTGIIASVEGGASDKKLTEWASASSASNAKDKIYFAKTTVSGDAISSLNESNALFSQAKLGSSGEKAIVAVTNLEDGKDLTAFYLVSAGSAGSTVASVTLIGTIDQDVDNTWTATATSGGGLYLA